MRKLAIARLTKAGFPGQCSWLQGSFMIPKDEAARKIDSANFKYILPEGSYALNNKKSNGASKVANTKDSKSKMDEYRDGLRDYQNGQILKLGKYSLRLLLPFKSFYSTVALVFS